MTEVPESDKPAPAAQSARKRVAVLISGRGSNMGALIAATLAEDYPARIVAVISDVADAKGLEHAREFGISAHSVPRKDYQSREEHEAAVSDAIVESGAEIICLAGYMRLLSGKFTNQWRGRIINIHPSLLPAFPGLDTHHRAIGAGCRVHGCTVHFVTEGMDEGPIIAQAAVQVLVGDTPETLAARVLEAEHLLYARALARLARGEVRMSGSGAAVFLPREETGKPRKASMFLALD